MASSPASATRLVTSPSMPRADLVSSRHTLWSLRWPGKGEAPGTATTAPEAAHEGRSWPFCA